MERTLNESLSESERRRHCSRAWLMTYASMRLEERRSARADAAARSAPRAAEERVQGKHYV